MSGERATELARTLIGERTVADAEFDPTAMAERLNAQAPDLAAVLRDQEIAVVAEQFAREDKDARRAEARFRRMTRLANWATLLTALTAAGVLFAGPFASLLGEPNADGPVFKTWFVSFGVVAIVSGALAALWIHRLQHGQMLARFRRARAQAEDLRLTFFERVTAAPAPAEPRSRVALLALQLEFFRRYQLEVQVARYAALVEGHRDGAERSLTLGSRAVGLASLGTGLAGLLGGVFGPAWTSLAVLGVVGAALASFAATREGVQQDRANAARYDRAREALEGLAAHLTAVRAMVERGSRRALADFVVAVHEELMAEHRQWLEDARHGTAALRNLEATLARAVPAPAPNALPEPEPLED